MAYTELRSSLISKLSECEEPAVPGDETFYHGRLLTCLLDVPRVTWGSTAAPSPDMSDCPPWLTASELEDSPASLEVKVGGLLDLLRASRHTVLYAGAGLSTSAGCRQRARCPPARARLDHRRTEAAPSVSHLTLASLVQV